MANGQSRFYQYITVASWQWALYDESLIKLTLIRVATVCANLCAFTFFLSKLLRNKPAAFCITAVFLSLVHVKNTFNGFHALPLWFNMPLTFAFLSLGFFFSYCEQHRKSQIIASVVFFAFALLYYESFLIYLPLFSLIHVQRQGANGLLSSAKALFLSLYTVRVLWLFYGVALIYLVAYFSFRHMHPSDYAGYNLGLTNYADILRVLSRFSFSGLSLGLPYDIKQLFYPSFQSLHLIYSFIPTLCISIVVFFHSRTIFRKLNWYVFTVLLILLFSPNLLHSLTLRYQEWAKHSHTYLGSYFSAYPLLTLLFFLLCGIFSKFRTRKIRQLATLVVALLSFLVFNYSIRTKTAFFSDMREYAKIHKTDQTMLKFLQTRTSLPEKIVSKSLFESNPTDLQAYDYWRLWARQYLQREISFLPDDEKKTSGFFMRIERNKVYDSIVYSLKNTETDQISYLFADFAGRSLDDLNRLIPPKIGQGVSCSIVSDEGNFQWLKNCSIAKQQ